MTTVEMVERIKKLDRMYLAAMEARDAFMAEPCDVLLRRWIYYHEAYRRYRNGG